MSIWQQVSGSVKPLAALAVVLILTIPAPGTSKYKVLYTFQNGGDGGAPQGSVSFDKQGNLYSTTVAGGAHNKGTVFQLTPTPKGTRKGQWSETVLYSFCAEQNCMDGWWPDIGVTIDQAGNLYGSTKVATTFELSPGSGGWQYQILLPCCGGGSEIPLLLDKLGDLYGWDVSELVRGADGWKLKILKEVGSNGLTWGPSGVLYSTASHGGNVKYCRISGGCGMVYELQRQPGGVWNENVLYTFAAFPDDGAVPDAGVVRDKEGNLYGTTSQGGAYTCAEAGCGTVYKLSRDSDGGWEETILYNFRSGNDGFEPHQGVVLDKAGDLYGTTVLGGNGHCPYGCGVAFKLTPGSDGTWAYSVLHRFTGLDDGANPGTVTLDDKGNVYGTAALGGKYGAGVVFEITP